MRYFTKEWYELMQQQIGVEGLTKVADKVYSDAEIQAFYERDLKKEIAHDRKLHNLKPTFELEEELLRPENFKPENFLFEDEAYTPSEAVKSYSEKVAADTGSYVH